MSQEVNLILSVLQINFQYDRSTSIVMSRSIQVKSSWFVNISNPLPSYSQNIF